METYAHIMARMAYNSYEHSLRTATHWEERTTYWSERTLHWASYGDEPAEVKRCKAQVRKCKMNMLWARDAATNELSQYHKYSK